MILEVLGQIEHIIKEIRHMTKAIQDLTDAVTANTSAVTAVVAGTTVDPTDAPAIAAAVTQITANTAALKRWAAFRQHPCRPPQ